MVRNGQKETGGKAQEGPDTAAAPSAIDFIRPEILYKHIYLLEDANLRP